jgi:SAM-dependent methyltransferase
LDPHYDFYRKTLASLLRDGHLTLDSRILVVCGGRADRDVFESLGFRDVVISNVDTRTDGAEFAPYGWSFQDAEALDYEPNSFDFCVVHSGLHHCESPHKGLLEMYRVARVGVLAFEPLDNLTTRVGVRLGFGQDYEIAAVTAENGYTFGGVRNTQIPNFVYRFTEREVVKTISSYAPYGRNRFLYFYALRIPWGRFRVMKNRLLGGVLLAAAPLLKLASLVFPRESNNFAFAVLKPALPREMHPWLRAEGDGIALNREWVQNVYNA